MQSPGSFAYRANSPDCACIGDRGNRTVFVVAVILRGFRCLRSNCYDSPDKILHVSLNVNYEIKNACSDAGIFFVSRNDQINLFFRDSNSKYDLCKLFQESCNSCCVTTAHLCVEHTIYINQSHAKFFSIYSNYPGYLSRAPEYFVRSLRQGRKRSWDLAPFKK